MGKPPSLTPQALYHPLSQVERPMDSPVSARSLDSEASASDEDVVEKRPRLQTRNSSNFNWRAARPRGRAFGRMWRVLVVVVALFVVHRFIPSEHQVPAQIASLSNSLPSQHGSFLHRWGLVSADDPLTSFIESRIDSPVPLAPYRLLFGTVQRSEGPALIEWVLHHLGLGADHFIIYDASHPSDALAASTRDRILPLVELGFVTLLPLADASPAAAHETAAHKFHNEWAAPAGTQRARWSAFLDVNEFLVHDAAGAEDGALPAWLDDGFERVDGVQVPRVWATAGAGAAAEEGAGVLEAHTALVALEEQDPFAAPRVLAQSRGELEREHVLVDPLGEKVDARHPAAHDEAELSPRVITERYPLYVRRYVRREKECSSGGEERIADGALEALDRQACGAGALSSVEEDDALVLRGERLSALVSRLEARWPVFNREDFRLSLLASPGAVASKRAALPRELTPGATLVVDSERTDVGHLQVVLSTAETRRYLPVTYLADGGAAFSLPPASSAELQRGGSVTLNITRQYASSPAPEMDPPTPCSIMGHLRNQPTRAQLLALREGTCRDTDTASVYNVATATWPHARLRGEEVLSRELRIAAPASPPKESAVEIAALTTGHWARHPLSELVTAAAAEGEGADPRARLYSSEVCPRAFASSYWDAACGTTERAEREGVLRWVPDGARSFADIALPASELRTCLGVGEKRDEDRRRIVIVGDSVASHSFMALQCLVSQLGVADSKQHIRFQSLQYEALDLAAGNMSREAWDRFLAWEWDAPASRAKSYPDVVVLNVGLWSATWTRAADYAAGLRASLSHLSALSYPANPNGPRLLWRETTPVFPSTEVDPLYQVNPRVRLLNALAADELARAGVPLLGVVEMVAARADAARDNAHLCPAVQGDLVEVLMHRVCRGGMMDR
ncbi:hypothetical protein JCM10450v2_007646 [Rhodotorula kratochvilovae]